MTIKSEKLIAELIEVTKTNLNQLARFNDLPIDVLNFKENPESWSILECIEHLNIYGNYYLPEIKQRISKSQHTANIDFKSGLLGNYFVQMIMPKNGQIKKMKTAKENNPTGSKLDKKVLDIFEKQQQQMLGLLNQARIVNLSKTKTGVSISKMIKIKLGDTLRFVIYHNQRHLNQASRVMQLQKDISK